MKTHDCRARSEEQAKRLARAVYRRLWDQIDGRRPPVSIADAADLELLDCLREAAAGNMREYRISPAGEIQPRT